MANPWTLYQRQSALALGFHGTDREVVQAVVSQQLKHLKKSENTTEWLGHGVYFWENDPERALDWAKNGKTRGKITAPDVVGAPFPEDDPLYEASGFRKRNHIQICIIRPDQCIKGYFRPIQAEHAVP